MEKENLFKMEVVTLNKGMFAQIRYYGEKGLLEIKHIRGAPTVQGWVEHEGQWVLFETGGTMGKCRAVDYVVALGDPKHWQDGISTQIMNKYQQIFLK